MIGFESNLEIRKGFKPHGPNLLGPARTVWARPSCTVAGRPARRWGGWPTARLGQNRLVGQKPRWAEHLQRVSHACPRRRRSSGRQPPEAHCTSGAPAWRPAVGRRGKLAADHRLRRGWRRSGSAYQETARSASSGGATWRRRPERRRRWCWTTQGTGCWMGSDTGGGLGRLPGCSSRGVQWREEVDPDAGNSGKATARGKDDQHQR
jgi:hypothetical protein